MIRLTFKKSFYVVALSALLLLAAACSPPASGAGDMPGEEPSPPADDGSTPTPTVDLTGSEWVLVHYGPTGGESEPLPDSTITLRFEDGQIAGSAGCNSYFGGYQLDGRSLTVGTLGSTEMWCEGWMDQERAYLSLLETVTTVEASGDRLVLTGPEGRLVYAEPAPAPDPALTGTVWELETLVQGETAQSVLQGSRITIEFSADGRVTGNAGCNVFGSQYTLDGDRLSFGLFETTLMACLEPGIMEQEALFLELLQAADSLSVQGDRLHLGTTGGELIFHPATHLSLVGTDWVLTGIAGDEAVVQTWIDERITARFEDGQVTGLAGCNSYFADVEFDFDGDRLSVGPVGATRKACEPEIMDRETEFLTALQEVAGYEIRLETLKLYDPAGELLLQFAGTR